MEKINSISVAWRDIKNSPGWFVKIVLLALLVHVPVFGAMVLYGYSFRWARDIAWGVHEPMPAKLLDNGDQNLYKRGFFIFAFLVLADVALYVALLVVVIPFAALDSVADEVVAAGAFILFAILFFIVWCLFVFIGSLRIAIYDRFSPGFQLGKIWKMLRYDTAGFLKIFGIALLLTIGLFAALSITILVLLLVAYGIPTSMIGFEATELFTGIVAGLFIFATMLAMVALEVFIFVLVARATGYWLQQFNIAKWGAPTDPFPFEWQQSTPQV